VSKINHVTRAKLPTTCDKCGADIPPGSPYQWIKLRSGNKRARCVKFSCRFRPTDLSTAKTAVIKEAIEDAEDLIATASDYESIQSHLNDVASIARDVAIEYQDASGAWASGSNDAFDEKADICESFADDLESWEYTGPCDEDEARKCAAEFGEDDEDEMWDIALTEMREEAISLLKRVLSIKPAFCV